MMYLASPYSHVDPLIMKNRMLLARQATEILMRKGKLIFSPIVYGDAFPQGLLGYAASDWWAFNREMLRRCSAIYCLCIPGAETSVGMEQEYELACAMGLPAFFINAEGEEIDPRFIPWL